jgi:hypothetical protein
MAQCVAIGASGVVYSSEADPCTTAVILTPAEYGVLANTPWNLSVEDGFALGWKIVLVWAVAYAARALILAARETGG